jgi:TRAP transporter 4TM/12TM fusion protein
MAAQAKDACTFEGLSRHGKLLRFVLSEGCHRKLSGVQSQIVSIVCFLLAGYQIWYSLLGRLDPMIHRAIHMGFILFLTFLSFGTSKHIKQQKVVWYDFILAFGGAAVGVYYLVFRDHILERFPMADPLTGLDMTMGIVFILLTFEAVRRTMGPSLAIVIVLLSGYLFLGPYISGGFSHRGTTPMLYVDLMAYTLDGILGSAVAVSSSFVFLFVLFGAFLTVSGTGDFFFQISNAVAGRTSGGPAKVAIVASALFGTISGSPTSDVVCTGCFTIPMMRKIGYRREFAGAVEAVAATGGAILPPVMGSSAFLMAEVAGIDYVKICAAAALPAILYYVALAIMVHLEAKKLNLPGLSSTEVPRVWDVLKGGWHHLIPLAILVGFLIAGRSPSYVAIVATVSVVVVSWFRKNSRMGFRKIYQAMVSGSKTAIVVSVACAGAGLVVGGVMGAGLGGKFSSVVMAIGQDNLFLSLALTAIVCSILGMGMPVAPAYMLTVVLAVPALLNLGVPLMSAHLFVVYYSVLSAITPPVAVAAFSASAFAEADPVKIGWQACRLGIVSFIVPFFFVYQPALLLMNAGLVEIAFTVITALIGVASLSVGMEGYFRSIVPWWQRVIFMAAGLLLISPSYLHTLMGAILFVGALGINRQTHKNREKHAALSLAPVIDVEEPPKL